MKKLLNHALLYTSLVLGWATMTTYLPDSFIKSMLSIAFLLTIPGHLLYRWVITEGKSKNFWPSLSYSISLSILYLMLVGLFVSALGPFVHISRPLSAVPLTTTITVTLLALIAIVLTKRREITLPELNLPTGFGAWTAVGIGALLPIMSAAGATILNNGGSGFIANTTIGLIAAYAVWMVWPRKLKLHKLFPYSIFMMALALLFANSLRGWHITGHDVMQEYQVFQITSTHGIWSMKNLQDAYTACLSITILPTILQKLSGLSDPYVYKFVFQTIFALVPAILYITIAKFLPLRAAFLGGLVFITFPTFLLDMSMLGRQEVAFLFFGLVLMTLFDSNLARRSKSILVLLLGLGMILSHYSTSYVAIGVILLAKVLELGVSRWDRWRHNKTDVRIVSMPLSWPISIALILTVYLWNSQITNTSQSIANTVVGVATGIPKIFGGVTESGVGSYSLVGHSLNDSQIFNQYNLSGHSLRDMPGTAYYPDSLTRLFPVTPAKEAVSPPTVLGTMLNHIHIPLYNLYDLARTDYAKLIQVLIIFGLAALAFRRQFAKVPRQYLLLGMASFGMIILEVFLPSVINYGILRMIQQSLMFMAPAIVLACYMVFKWLRFNPLWRVRATALLFIGFYLVNSGFLNTLTGGYKPSLSTSNSGLYYQAYYTHAEDIAGGQWLDAKVPVGSVVNSDEFTYKKLVTYANIYSRPTLNPVAISTNSYVFISDGDSVAGSIPFYFNGKLLYENIPSKFLDQNKNLIYNNGPVTIYK